HPPDPRRRIPLQSGGSKAPPAAGHRHRRRQRGLRPSRRTAYVGRWPRSLHGRSAKWYYMRLAVTQPAGTETRGKDRRLDDEQAALRRVATLVAEGAAAGELFAAVAVEVVQVLDVPTVMVARFEPKRAMTVLASLNEASFTVGSRWPLDGPSVAAQVLDAAAPARIDDY